MKSQDRSGTQLLLARRTLPLREILWAVVTPSWLKIRTYRLRGYRIGKDVRLGVGAVIKGKSVTVGEGVTLGAGAIVHGDDVVIRRGASIGRTTLVSSTRVRIGEDAGIEADVWISNGSDRPDSHFELGDLTTIQRLSFVNCQHGVSIGDGSGIGGHCLIFTHGQWLSWFDGYPRQAAPVTIGRDVWLPWRVFVLPGTEIGDGVVVGADSLVGGRIPANSLVAGVPARVLKTYPGKVEPEERIRRLTTFADEALAHLSTMGLKVNGTSVLGPDGREYRLRLAMTSQQIPEPSTLSPRDVIISNATLSDEWRHSALVTGTPWFDMQVAERSDRMSAFGNELVALFASFGQRFRRR